MEVLLLQDVANVGKKNDLLVVGDGFALNFLLPTKIALVATPLIRKKYAELIQKRAEEREHEKKQKMGTLRTLAGKSVQFAKKTTKTGKLYAAISEKAIADALSTELGIVVSPDAIMIADPIKSLGSFQVKVKLEGIEETLNVNVSAVSA